MRNGGATDSMDKKKRTLLPPDRHVYPVLCNKMRIHYAVFSIAPGFFPENRIILPKHHPVYGVPACCIFMYNPYRGEMYCTIIRNYLDTPFEKLASKRAGHKWKLRSAPVSISRQFRISKR